MEEDTNSLLRSLIERINKLFDTWKHASFVARKTPIRKVRRCSDLTETASGSVVLLGTETLNVRKGNDMVCLEFTIRDAVESHKHVSVYQRYFVIFVVNHKGVYETVFCSKFPFQHPPTTTSIYDDITEDTVAVSRLLYDSLKISNSTRYSRASK